MAVLLAALAAHLGALGGGFVYDDRPAILENPVVQGAWDAGELLRRDFWGRPPGAGAPATWRPLVEATLWADWHRGGGEARAFHVTNWLLHGLAALALGLALRVQTGRSDVALAAAGVFAVMGAGSEAVAGIVGRADVMAAGLAMLAWAAAGRPADTDGRGEAGAARIAAAGGLACLAMLCKESAVVLPLLVIGCDVVLGGGRAARRGWPRYLALGLALVAAVALRLHYFGSPAAVARAANNNPLVDEALGVRLLTAPRLFLLALRVLVLPINTSADYSFAEVLPERSLLSADVLAGLAALALLAGAVPLLRDRRPAAALGALLLVVGWLPASNAAFALPAIFAERLLYLPAAGAALLLADLAAFLGERLGRPAGLVVLGGVMAGNAALAVVADRTWRDDLTLFSQAVSVSTRSARAWLNYGTALDRAGRPDEALEAVERGLAIAPGWAALHAEAGALLDRAGRRDEAASALQRAVTLDPADARSAFNLALFLARHGDRPAALAAARRYLANNPGRLADGAPLRRLEADLAARP